MGSCKSGSKQKSVVAGLKIDLDYALMKAKEYGNVKYGGTKKTQEMFRLWNDEVRRLQKQLSDIESKKK